MADNILISDIQNDSECRRFNAVKRKKQEFKHKQQIIQKALGSIDNTVNKKTFFDEDTYDDSKDCELESKTKHNKVSNKQLFNEDDEEDDNKINFEVKSHFEGEKGHKILDLQSRYKSDKRFVLDERFVDEELEHNKDEDGRDADHHTTEPKSEKEVQYNILEEILGVQINHKSNASKNTRPQLGMIRFDPTNPEHSKFLAPIEKVEPEVLPTKKRKKQKDDQTEEKPVLTENKPEVSQEKFYKVSETLKDAFTQPKAEGFRLLSIFDEPEEKDHIESMEQECGHVNLEQRNIQRMKNPLDPGEKNPFVYDSSESEEEKELSEETKNNASLDTSMHSTQAVWKESLFFSEYDDRLKDGLAFFTKVYDSSIQKDRRELKFLMKKRLYNNERKKQVFKHKIGGKRKSSSIKKKVMNRK